MTEQEEYNIIRDVIEEESLYFSFLHMKNNFRWDIIAFLKECESLYDGGYAGLYRYEGPRIVDVNRDSLKGIKNEEDLKEFNFYPNQLAIDRYNQVWPKFQRT